MEQNWKAVAEALHASRLAAGLTQEDLAERAGTSRSTIQNLEMGVTRRRISRKTIEVLDILDWPEGYVDQLLAGEAVGPPTRRTQAEVSAPEPRSDLPLAIAHELGHGDLIDTQVVELGGSDARMIVVVRAGDGASPEQVREALEAWRRVQQSLRNADSRSE
ncbi:helix-turn-helix domain-containing protein [Streptomyces sp. NPDC090077]|uniref:helix-turn-helix domain-containing protein n=1 Tax=Streptomyces sp. NPDC090077 TaxID=3365938 RepID=UPI00381E04AC